MICWLAHGLSPTGKGIATCELTLMPKGHDLSKWIRSSKTVYTTNLLAYTFVYLQQIFFVPLITIYLMTQNSLLWRKETLLTQLSRLQRRSEVKSATEVVDAGLFITFELTMRTDIFSEQ